MKKPMPMKHHPDKMPMADKGKSGPMPKGPNKSGKGVPAKKGKK